MMDETLQKRIIDLLRNPKRIIASANECVIDLSARDAILEALMSHTADEPAGDVLADFEEMAVDEFAAYLGSLADEYHQSTGRFLSDELGVDE